MTTILIILVVLQSALIVAQVWMFKTIDKRFYLVEKDLLVTKQLYDSLEEQVSKQYAAIAAISTKKEKKKQTTN